MPTTDYRITRNPGAFPSTGYRVTVEGPTLDPETEPVMNACLALARFQDSHGRVDWPVVYVERLTALTEEHRKLGVTIRGVVARFAFKNVGHGQFLFDREVAVA
jgi:hypothetical protein